MALSVDMPRLADGRARIPGLDFDFGVASIVEKIFNGGEKVWHPLTDTKITLSEAPEFSSMELTTPAVPVIVDQFLRWTAEYDRRRTEQQTADDISIVISMNGIRYLFSQCGIERHTVFPGYDKNGRDNASKDIKITLSIGKFDFSEVA